MRKSASCVSGAMLTRRSAAFVFSCSSTSSNHANGSCPTCEGYLYLTLLGGRFADARCKAVANLVVGRVVVAASIASDVNACSSCSATGVRQTNRAQKCNSRVAWSLPLHNNSAAVTFPSIAFARKPFYLASPHHGEAPTVCSRQKKRSNQHVRVLHLHQRCVPSPPRQFERPLAWLPPSLCHPNTSSAKTPRFAVRHTPVAKTVHEKFTNTS
jgi:hypothetical protein